MMQLATVAPFTVTHRACHLCVSDSDTPIGHKTESVACRNCVVVYLCHVQVCVACLGMAAACGLLMRAESRAESQLVQCGLELDPSLTNPWTGLIGVPTIGLLAGILLKVHLSSTCMCTDHVDMTDTAYQTL